MADRAPAAVARKYTAASPPELLPKISPHAVAVPSAPVVTTVVNPSGTEVSVTMTFACGAPGSSSKGAKDAKPAAATTLTMGHASPSTRVVAFVGGWRAKEMSSAFGPTYTGVE
jgi:hypothetical protein